MLVKIAAALFIFSIVFLVGAGIFALIMKNKNNKKNYK